MTRLEIKAFEGQINLKLLDDIISFATQTAGTSYQQKQSLQRRCMFPCQNTSASRFQDKYGFLYLGELLERYEERFGMTVQDRRAIALALGYTRDIVKDEMFVGSQRTDFIQAVRRDAGNDLYLTGALYLLYEGEQGRLPYEGWLKNRQYTQTEELIFTISLFPDVEQAFQHFKPQLGNLLGPGRTMPVLENTGIFKWITAALFPLKKQMKGKNDALFRALLALPASFVKEGSKPYECLQKHGYTPLEIAYANAMAVYDLWVDSGVRNQSLLAEKIMVALFQTVLEHKDALPAAVYEQLTAIYTAYKEFEIKCYEVRRLPDTLKCVRIKSPETMAWFIGRTSVLHPANSSFDIMDSEWDVLASSLSTDVYSQLFETSLTEEMDAAGLRQRIKRYDELAGKSYLDRYWVSQGGYCFSLLVKAGIFDLWTAFQASIDSDGAVVKGGMLHHIGRHIHGIQTPQAFEFLKKFMPQYGYPGLKTYFEEFSDGFTYQLWEARGYHTPAIPHGIMCQWVSGL